MRQTAVTQPLVTENMFQSPPFLPPPALAGPHGSSTTPTRPGAMVRPSSPALASSTRDDSKPDPHRAGESPTSSSHHRASQLFGQATANGAASGNLNSSRGQEVHATGRRRLTSGESSRTGVREEPLVCMDTNATHDRCLDQFHEAQRHHSLSFATDTGLNSSDLPLQGQSCLPRSPSGRLDNVPVQTALSTSNEARDCHSNVLLVKLADISLALRSYGVPNARSRSTGDMSSCDPSESPLDNRADSTSYLRGERNGFRCQPCICDNQLSCSGDDVTNGNLCSEGQSPSLNDNENYSGNRASRTLQEPCRHCDGVWNDAEDGYEGEDGNEADFTPSGGTWRQSKDCDFPPACGNEMEVEEEIPEAVHPPRSPQTLELSNGTTPRTETDLDGVNDLDETIVMAELASASSTMYNGEAERGAFRGPGSLQPSSESSASSGTPRSRARDGRANPHLAFSSEGSASIFDDSPQLPPPPSRLELPEQPRRRLTAPNLFGSPPTLCAKVGEARLPVKPEARLGAEEGSPAAPSFLLPPIWTPLALHALQATALRAVDVAPSLAGKMAITATVGDKAPAGVQIIFPERPRFSDVVSLEAALAPRACSHALGRRERAKWSRGGRGRRCEGESSEARGSGPKRALYLRVASTGGGGGAGGFEEALLDDECSLFSCRFTSSLLRDVSVVDRGLQDPVAATLQQGDDMHFIPIRDETSRPAPLQGSAFTCYTPL